MWKLSFAWVLVAACHAAAPRPSTRCDEPARFVPAGSAATADQVALDATCADMLAARDAPAGWIAVFGSSRVREGSPDYESARRLAALSTRQMPGLPIATGGGTGIMEAANRGAREAGGASLALGVYFAADDRLGAYVTSGRMLADLETRERALVRHARAVVIYAGGLGTAWELFMTLSDLQTGRIRPLPVVLVGSEWAAATRAYLEAMRQRGAISDADLRAFVVVDTAEQAVEALQRALSVDQSVAPRT